MRRRAIAIVLAVIMTASMGMTALAEEMVPAEAEIAEAVEESAEDVEDVEEEVPAAEEIETAEGTKEVTEAPVEETPAEVIPEEEIDNDQVTPGNILISDVTFPDSSFREYVLANIDKNGDHELSASERSITKLDIHGKGIVNFKGIENFTNVTELDVSSNRLESLNITNLVKLNILDCSDNNIKAVDLSKATNLTELHCSNNRLTTLNLSGNTRLTILDCSDNTLSALDLSKNVYLVAVDCSGNKLTSLAPTKQLQLMHLYCSDNGMLTLNISACSALQTLDCGANKFATLDISKLYELEELYCSGGALTSLDPTQNSLLKVLDVENNKLTKLNVTKNPLLEELYASGNPIRKIELHQNTKLTKTSLAMRVTVEGCVLDVSKVSGFDVTKLSNITQLVRKDKKFEPALKSDKKTYYNFGSYTYDCGGGKKMTMEISFLKTPDQVPKGTVFFDMEDKDGWRLDSAKFVKQKGLMTGISGTGANGLLKFEPDNPITRAMFATILHRMQGSPKVEYKKVFTDVPKDRYFSVPITWASEQGIIKGYNGTKLFGTDDNISRQDIVVLLYRLTDFNGQDCSKRASLAKFKDANQVSAYAKEPMQWAVAHNIIKGRSDKGTIDPKGKATRIEAAAMLLRYYERWN